MPKTLPLLFWGNQDLFRSPSADLVFGGLFKSSAPKSGLWDVPELTIQLSVSICEKGIGKFSLSRRLPSGKTHLPKVISLEFFDAQAIFPKEGAGRMGMARGQIDCILVLLLLVSVLAVVSDISWAMPHHHHHGRSEAVEMLAAGLIAKMLSEMHG
ncbi:hypothetical protein TNIN_484811 [Trichonephila inaurata madagascariensis]|uniref:Uncharacterized protein n=1 Tax=Trichonephila inaurata madagascariensis TaxID=2747483 RepID=A0A8X6YB10_9ARAC|nr:hypothetical protein TNIN_484811 [Trichonephila inaurata madagascariensis]